MNHDESPSEPQTSPFSVAGALNPRRFGRRGLLIGAAASVVPLVAIERGLQGARQFAAATPPAALGTPAPATPEASPVAATPVAPAPTATIGQLQVIDDQKPVYSSKPVDGGALNLVLTAGDNSDFSPVAMRQDFQIMASYLDPLVWIDEVTMEPKPWLAKSWSYSKDGKTLTFKLQNNVNWHDGSRLTADDVVFSLFVYRDDVDSAVRNIFQTMDLAKKIDEYTVEVDLNAPDGNFIFNAASQLMFQKKQYTKYWSANPEGERSLTGFDYGKSAPLGTGPFVIGKRSSKSIHASRNGKYWQEPAHVDGVTFTWQPDTTSRLKSFRDGGADILWPVQPADLELVKDAPGRVYVADAASVMFAAFNFNNPKRTLPDLFADIRLRQALSLAVDRDRYAKQIFGGYIHQGKAGTVAQPWANDVNLANPAHDVKAAKSLLKQAGWEDRDKSGTLSDVNGEKLDLSVIVQSDARGDLLALLQNLVADFKAIGVALTVRSMDAKAFAGAWINTHDFDLIAYGYNLYPGFTDFDLYGSGWDIRTNSQGWNPGGYKNADVDATIKALLSESSSDQQRASLIKLQQQTNDDLFALWFGFPRDLVLVREDILGYQPDKLCQVWDLRLLWRQGGASTSA